MAMFREHIAIGAILSMVVVVAVYFYALITDPWLLLILFAVTTIGSFLPDVDSDSGMPFYLVFGTMTLAATGVVLLYVLSSSYATDWRYLAGIPLAALVFFWAVVGGILKKCTRHRGIFHSLPAMVIAGVATFLIAERFGLSDLTSLVFGAAMAVGFASHLALDELHSFVDLEGIPFIPKKSLGTALKLFSDSNRVNMATYIVLVALVYTAFGNPLQADAFYSLDAESASQLCCEDESAPFQNSAPGGRSYSSKNAMVAAPTARLAFYNDSDGLRRVMRRRLRKIRDWAAAVMVAVAKTKVVWKSLVEARGCREEVPAEGLPAVEQRRWRDSVATAPRRIGSNRWRDWY